MTVIERGDLYYAVADDGTVLGRHSRTHGPIQMRMSRNLSRRLAKPAAGNGRVQRGARRALWALGTASTPQIALWTHPRARAYGELSDNHTRAARRVLLRIADRVKRVPPYGAWTWRLRD
jgi:hypothetical protein